MLSAARPSKSVKKFIIDDHQFDNLLILEAETDLVGESQRDILAEIQDARNNTIPFFPASSCRRLIFIFQKSDISREITPRLFDFINKDATIRDTMKIYEGKDGLAFLTMWLSGGLNIRKYHHDTYNKKTANISFDTYKELLNILSLCRRDSEKKFSSVTSDMIDTIDLKMRSLGSETSDYGWLKSEKDETIRMRRIGVNRFRDESHQAEFSSLLDGAQKISNFLCYIFEKIKTLPEIKELWSEAITKSKLELMHTTNRGLFDDIISCRKRFVGYVAKSLVVASESIAPHDIKKNLLRFLPDDMTTEIATLSSMARGMEAAPSGGGEGFAPRDEALLTEADGSGLAAATELAEATPSGGGEGSAAPRDEALLTAAATESGLAAAKEITEAIASDGGEGSAAPTDGALSGAEAHRLRTTELGTSHK